MATKDVTIATFNVENLDDADPVWKERVKVLRPMLTRVRADVLLLQEVHAMAALDDLVKGTEYAQFERVYTKTKSGKAYAKRNLVILSRFPIAGSKQYLHDLVPAPTWTKVTASPPEDGPKPVEWERPILHAEITLPGNVTLHAVDVHLKSMNPTPIKGQTDPDKYWLWRSHGGWAEGYYLSDVKRVGQALETRVLVDTIFADDGEGAWIAVGGDFNAEVGSVPFKAIVGSVEDTQNPALRATVLVPCEYNVPPDQRYSLLHHGRGNMLDHVLVSQALYPHWVGTSIFNEVLHDESQAFSSEEKFPESDHAPVVARFKFPSGGE